MNESKIKKNVEEIRKSVERGNVYGEKVLIVAATKMQTAECINQAIQAGVDAVAENKVQEFREKTDKLLHCPQHFIGHLQTNKVKYLIGKIALYHSCDRDDLVKEIARLSVKNNVVSNVLIQINIGNEESKGGYNYDEAKQAFLRISQMQGLCVKGFMAMLPNTDDESLLVPLIRKMRTLYEWAKEQLDSVEYLSMGMSGDYKLCIENGSNIIRVGSNIFGLRPYH